MTIALKKQSTQNMKDVISLGLHDDPSRSSVTNLGTVVCTVTKSLQWDRKLVDGLARYDEVRNPGHVGEVARGSLRLHQPIALLVAVLNRASKVIHMRFAGRSCAILWKIPSLKILSLLLFQLTSFLSRSIAQLSLLNIFAFHKRRTSRNHLGFCRHDFP